MNKRKRIAILTSGGDCSGLNAAIRAATLRAINHYGWEVLGVQRATQGLMNHPPDVVELTVEKVNSILTMGGTFLGTANQGNPFAFKLPDGSIENRSAAIGEAYRTLGLDALIGIGGDGSISILEKLAEEHGINLVTIPKTIDNDVDVTEWAVGFHTAVNIATEALDRLHFTAASHSRVMILEVMGRDAGHIAISAGIAGGADVILIPEIPYSMDHICEKIAQQQRQGKNYCLIIVSEAVKTEEGEPITCSNASEKARYGGIGNYLADRIAECNGAETRVMVLGHLQRGGIPSPMDRLIASAFGVAAVDLIAQEKFNRMVAWQNRQVIDIPILDAIRQYRPVDREGTVAKTARGLGIYLGD
ncbi:ATP-dependent 6-phosphofructokinase [filamentous cyanobacterium LEGE 11480]|uniref:ATP-dependent 6-phosphofructokinase n=1 Tax=Romeriopsis navalis LEGE 11480 TaxID=2777977 RepID=A0A928VMJ6_9CYAN|nr:ATP-dependent 6-phosphofructokinase [Romeriopsis navalis]MBE9028739.1 ATP-dependent 6-phosphofructokinase [Romeriopsis navalis LEGE 11480]